MKAAATLIILTLATVLYGQDKGSDSLATIKLDYEKLDSNEIKAKKPVFNKQFENIVSYNSDNGLKVAYYTTDKNKWYTVTLAIDERTDDFKIINLDKKGQPEIILTGQVLQYGSGGGTATKWMMIYNIDSVPTQLFKITYGCYEEDFGDKTKDGAGAFSKGYDRKIKITNSAIIISSLDKKQYPFEGCGLTEIPSGTYIMENGQMKKKK